MTTEEPDDRPRVLVRLPGGQGTITARLVQWVRRHDGTGPGPWDALVHWTRWAATSAPGHPGVKTEPMGDYMPVPRDHVEPIPGEDYSGVRRVVEAPASRRELLDVDLGTFGERAQRST